ncbi:hypothetical protein V8017_02890 [Stenotrophomonas rhizophila]
MPTEPAAMLAPGVITSDTLSLTSIRVSRMDRTVSAPIHMAATAYMRRYSIQNAPNRKAGQFQALVLAAAPSAVRSRRHLRR